MARHSPFNLSSVTSIVLFIENSRALRKMIESQLMNENGIKLRFRIMESLIVLEIGRESSFGWDACCARSRTRFHFLFCLNKCLFRSQKSPFKSEHMCIMSVWKWRRAPSIVLSALSGLAGLTDLTIHKHISIETKRSYYSCAQLCIYDWTCSITNSFFFTELNCKKNRKKALNLAKRHRTIENKKRKYRNVIWIAAIDFLQDCVSPAAAPFISVVCVRRACVLCVPCTQ